MTRIFAPPRPAVKPSSEDLAPDPALDRAPYTAADLAWAAYHLNADCIGCNPFGCTPEY
jgi:hypothetical protein